MNEPQSPSYRRLEVAPLATIAARRICFIKPSALGDVVQSLPIVHALRHRFPTASIAWVINDQLAPLIENTGLVDQVIRFERHRFQSIDSSSRKGIQTLAQSLAKDRFDLTIDLQGLLRSAMLGLATRAPVRIGLASAREGAVYTYTHLAADGHLETNAVDRYWSVAKLLGAGSFPKSFDLRLNASETQWAADQLAPWPRPWLAIHPGAKWITKRFPVEKFAQAAREWSGRTGGTAITIGTLDDHDLAENIRLQFAGHNYLDLVGKTSLRQLAALLHQVDRLLTNDTGPMHLAAAMGTPTVSVFTCTSPIRSGPYGPGHMSYQTTVPCRASYKKECDHRQCMHQLAADGLVPLLTQDGQPISIPSRAA
jgi:lipopolysaccharide heptosyltransferase I